MFVATMFLALTQMLDVLRLSTGGHSSASADVEKHNYNILGVKNST